VARSVQRASRVAPVHADDNPTRYMEARGLIKFTFFGRGERLSSSLCMAADVPASTCILHLTSQDIYLAFQDLGGPKVEIICTLAYCHEAYLLCEHTW
jgi:hypothetical protein